MTRINRKISSAKGISNTVKGTSRNDITLTKAKPPKRSQPRNINKVTGTERNNLGGYPRPKKSNSKKRLRRKL